MKKSIPLFIIIVVASSLMCRGNLMPVEKTFSVNVDTVNAAVTYKIFLQNFNPETVPRSMKEQEEIHGLESDSTICNDMQVLRYQAILHKYRNESRMAVNTLTSNIDKDKIAGMLLAKMNVDSIDAAKCMVSLYVYRTGELAGLVVTFKYLDHTIPPSVCSAEECIGLFQNINDAKMFVTWDEDVDWVSIAFAYYDLKSIL